MTRGHRRALAAILCLTTLTACTDTDDPPLGSAPESTAPPHTTAGASTSDPPEGPEIDITGVSTRPGYATGGDIILAVDGIGDEAQIQIGDTDAVPLASLTVEVPQPAGPPPHLAEATLVRVTDLSGEPTTVTVTDGDATGTVEVTDNPLEGPLFSGPHQDPYLCTTASFGLDPGQEGECSAAAVTESRFLDAGGTWQASGGPANPDPDDIAVGAGGEPIVVEVERGTINRAVYETATPRAWNGMLVYVFGGGCGGGYTQGSFLGSRPRDQTHLLSAGYAVASSTLNTFQTTCNDVLSAETLMMVKEHFVESVGLPRYTLGHGGSGGAIQQYLIAQNYPGLLDAISPSISFPDAITTAPGVSDCGLLAAFWQTPEGQSFSDPARLAVQGHGSLLFCASWISSFLSLVSPTAGCPPDLPTDQLYDAEERPDGVRCTLTDANANLFGIDAATGFAHRPLDNTGVEYGRNALAAGTISVDQFLDLNEGIGGYDIDGVIGPTRTEAAQEVIEHAYRTGRVLQGESALAEVPIIDVDLYTDLTADIHDRFRPFSVRDRLADAGVTGTQSIWTRPGVGLTDLLGSEALPSVEIVDLLVEWLEAVDLDDPDRPAAVAEARPDAANDDCVAGDQRLTGTDIYETDNACTDEYVIFGDPRTAAGAPRRNDIIKCALTPVDANSYGVTFSASQAERLDRIFADGVCDWTTAGVGQASLDDVWLTY